MTISSGTLTLRWASWLKCADWTKFPGRVGQVLHVDFREGIYKEKGHINGMLCKVLVDGQIRDFLGWDVTVISE